MKFVCAVIDSVSSLPNYSANILPNYMASMDVHDVGEYKVEGEWRLLEPGMVMTVEPGLYFPASSDLARKWWNIGVRIEDDVLVTRDGHDVLSKDLPKDAETIQTIMAS